MVLSKEQLDELHELNALSEKIIGAAIAVHKELGPGLLESVYEACLIDELTSIGLKSTSQIDLPIVYKGKQLEKKFRLDILVENKIVIELKAVDELKPVHEVQLVTYLKLADKRLGLLINFNVPVLTKGIKRKINGY